MRSFYDWDGSSLYSIAAVEDDRLVVAGGLRSVGETSAADYFQQGDWYTAKLDNDTEFLAFSNKYLPPGDNIQSALDADKAAVFYSLQRLRSRIVMHL